MSGRSLKNDDSHQLLDSEVPLDERIDFPPTTGTIPYLQPKIFLGVSKSTCATPLHVIEIPIEGEISDDRRYLARALRLSRDSEAQATRSSYRVLQGQEC